MKFWKFRKQIIFFCKNLSDFMPKYCENLNFSTNINTIFEIHDPKKLKFLKFVFEQMICLIFMIKKNTCIFLKVWKWSTYDQLQLLASEAPCSFISKNHMKSLKPGHHIAKILLFRTHHLKISTTELTLRYSSTLHFNMASYSEIIPSSLYFDHLFLGQCI